ncbi:hypothetical protein [Sphingomonas kyeonggiensis]|uniref:Uncharacterized protein n=1 Tax=Sphingomonas kyeonggiensis TaxID=1268553 RepID=A0A7W6JWA3_9SPHN|nr:hypothetical protein [Sphingomonas kyeonggiensis]MBB4099620.1 hypothetical protein [Sphingomonas kyeonggiensis]
MAMIRSLDEICLRVISGVSQKLIREAIRCYEASAYRAAIISAWIAVSSDLIEKLRELAGGGDARAKELEASLDNFQERLQNNDGASLKGLLEFERNLIDFFKQDFQFFGSNEYIEISRLREDRHRCAHPSYDFTDNIYQPSAEAARLHVVNAIELVLSRSPTSGKPALERLISLVSSRHFPERFEDVVIRLKASEFGQARESLIKAFVDTMIYQSVEEGSDLYLNMSAVIALHASIEMYRETAFPRAIQQINKLIPKLADQHMWVAAAEVFMIPDLRPEIDLANRATLSRWIENEEGDLAASSVNFALSVD